jgi:hypothetical protein
MAGVAADLPLRRRRSAIAFREHLYERVRMQYAAHAPRRLDSFFVCKSLEAVRAYRKRHRLGEVNCKLKALGKHVAFQADMTHLDRVSLSQNFASAVTGIRRYWLQETSDDPLIEVLLQGHLVLLTEMA